MTAKDSSPGNILIADDACDSRQLLTRLVEQFTRARVHTARDGAEALGEFLLLRPRLTFLDIDMPEMGGVEVLARIREQQADAFVVIVSGHGALERVQEAIKLGVNGFVVKPFSAQRILDMLRHFCVERSVDGLLREPEA
jgi:YesN/AraC family two-component response regulator